jgi:predicted PhzF superfamily epimerase YddE/YHI9
VPVLHVLRVFTGDDGSGGNPLGVFLEGAAIDADRRQDVAADLGFSETVFVDDARRGRLAVFTPAAELDFAGHPLVGTAWLLASEGRAVSHLRPPAGEVPTRQEGELSFIAGRPEWGPALEHHKLDSPDDVDALDGPPAGQDLVGCWAWEDEAGGIVRCRVFAASLGIDEDEATGSHAIRLASALRRPLVIHQGEGSTLLARPLDDGFVEVGGRVAHVVRREYDVG